MGVDLRFTHVGLFVQSVDVMAKFYRDVMLFTQTDRGVLGDSEIVFLSREPREHHQLVFVAGLPGPPAHEVINQLSFRVADLEGLLDFHRWVKRWNVEDLQPINHGNAWSIYFRDPENNRIEVYTPSPWYISQPCRVPLSIDQSADEIRRQTKDWCARQPGFAPASEFSAKVAQMIAARAGELSGEEVR